MTRGRRSASGRFGMLTLSSQGPGRAATSTASITERAVAAAEKEEDRDEPRDDLGQEAALEPVGEEAAEAERLFSVLMGEDVESRRSFITRNAKDVRFLDI